MKKGNRIAKAAIEFEEHDSFMAGFHLVGFTICDDPAKGMFVLFPASIAKRDGQEDARTFFFLRPSNPARLAELEHLILDTYENMISFNNPKGG